MSDTQKAIIEEIKAKYKNLDDSIKEHKQEIRKLKKERRQLERRLAMTLSGMENDNKTAAAK